MVQEGALPESWKLELHGIRLKISPTDFGHLGIFPEHAAFWPWIQSTLAVRSKTQPTKPKVLHLFAYSGGATLAAALGGAEVCHLDASKGMTAWARENAALNNLQDLPIRWIVDDVLKFVQRELRRGSSYDAIILDPPTFGRGTKGELFMIEKDIVLLLDCCRKLLSKTPLFVLFSCHTPGFTPIALTNLLKDSLKGLPGTIDDGEMYIQGEGSHKLPSGAFSRWQHG